MCFHMNETEKELTQEEKDVQALLEQFAEDFEREDPS